jgi:hypothetical protein
MNTPNPNLKPTLGFLTVVEDSQYGLCGGYLILNTSGRPLEFHCTTPIKPNRAQEILYGPTLEAFLFGEQIGRTLIQQSNAPPIVVYTDQVPAMIAREYISIPMVLVLPTKEECEANVQGPEDMAEAAVNANIIPCVDAPNGGRRFVSFQFGRNRLALPDRADEDRRVVTECLSGLSDSFDLSEPFGRIRVAIEEAQHAAVRD